MTIIIIILLVLAGIIALLLIAAFLIKKDHYVKREIVINVQGQKAFDFLKLLGNQEKFNNHAMAGGERKKSFKGTDGTVGYIYAWSGDKNAGEGEKEIINLVEGQRVETEIRFVKPMKATSRIVMEIQALSDIQIKVSWSNAGKLPYPVNIMVPIMERMLPKDMDKSLVNLKNILENQ